MSNQPRGASRLSAVLIALASLVAGGAIAAAAVNQVVTSSAPNDSSAVQTGPKELVEPSELINYGG
ncbi:hypothetical protein [Intrasporangium calvum]|uniref:Uncharacterized protein n=1 Tax=Intrasporangium calvum (strain ATCC 23552 / DSM 43043 / JCM 3097 / NBRC 12989 / NCIMB 10167 / NRRL B-3866 / 7 KIP) TaxID=710696 RepID=E6S9H6_INTC7|nr:hypothetical protein [Intrasporangium calvum]ADU48172.1 hypothetical protein Intca_1659 [Intrasporangium calvum DSM 43043]